MSGDRRLFGLVRFFDEYARIDCGERIPRGWGFAWDARGSGKWGAWVAPIPFNWIIYWFMRLWLALLNPRRFDLRYKPGPRAWVYARKIVMTPEEFRHDPTLHRGAS